MKELFGRILRSLNINGRDLPLLLFSLLLAFSIWLIYNLALKYTDFLQVPVVARCNIEGHSAVSSNRNDVIARCRTTGYNIMRIRSFSGKTGVEIPFSKMHQKSSEIFYVTSNDLQEYTLLIFGENVTVESFLTDTLFFRFPFETSKRVPVRPVGDIELDPQYSVSGELRIEPDSVTIYGEPYRLEKIDYVYTEPVKLSGVRSGVRGMVRLEKIKGIRLSDDSAEYSVDVVRYVEIPSVVNISSRNVPKGKDMMIFPSSAQVLYKCVFPYSGDSTDEVQFYVDYNDFISSRSGKCVVRTDALPEDIIGYKIEPQVFECVMSER